MALLQSLTSWLMLAAIHCKFFSINELCVIHKWNVYVVSLFCFCYSQVAESDAAVSRQVNSHSKCFVKRFMSANACWQSRPSYRQSYDVQYVIKRCQIWTAPVSSHLFNKADDSISAAMTPNTTLRQESDWETRSAFHNSFLTTGSRTKDSRFGRQRKTRDDAWGRNAFNF
jgi:hypothetical protein